jgi:hypothetical protein
MANSQNLKPFVKGFDIRRGRKPKGSKHVSTHIRSLLEDIEISYNFNGSEVKGTPIDAIIKFMMINAINGDMRAVDLLFKYGYGLPKEMESNEQIVVVTRAHQFYK